MINGLHRGAEKHGWTIVIPGPPDWPLSTCSPRGNGRQHTGTPSVYEEPPLRSSAGTEKDRLSSKKTSARPGLGATTPLYPSQDCRRKHRKHGKIMLVGLGRVHDCRPHAPDRRFFFSPKPDTVIGYAPTYEWSRSSRMAKEVSRQKAMNQKTGSRQRKPRSDAQRGKKKVAPIRSSGDAGVYGHAGTNFRSAVPGRWTPDEHEVRSFRRLGAHTCAAMVGGGVHRR